VGKGFFSVSKTTDCIIIIQMDFRGTADEWESPVPESRATVDALVERDWENLLAEE
jgi:hypothetical protein